MSTVIAVVVALVAAVLFGLSDVVEQRTTHEVPERAALSPRLLVDLAKRRVWVAAIAVNVVGNILQIVALHFGALALVQPILVCDLLFAAPVLAIITTVDPLLSIGVAHAWLGETITSTPLALAGEIIALIIMTGGIVALAQRSPHVMSRKPGLSGTADPGMTPGSLESPR
jgi:hypothetical protein